MISADEIAFAGKSDRVFQRVGEGHYQLTVESLGVDLIVSRLRLEKHELWGELAVYTSIRGAKTTDGCLSTGSFNLSAPPQPRSSRGLFEGARTDRRLDRLARPP